jgi:hypothetical protein
MVMMLLSHAGDDANEVTWPWRDVDSHAGDGAAKSCYRWRSRGDLAAG